MLLRRLRSERMSSMQSSIRARLTYANVMSTIAVFLALGGGSLAAVSGDKADQSAHHKADGSGDNGGGDQGGKGGKDKGGKSKQSDNNNGGADNGSASDNTNPNGSLRVTTRNGDPVSTDTDTDEAVASTSCDKD